MSTPVTKMLWWQTEKHMAKGELAKAGLCVKRDDEWLERKDQNQKRKIAEG